MKKNLIYNYVGIQIAWVVHLSSKPNRYLGTSSQAGLGAKFTGSPLEKKSLWVREHEIARRGGHSDQDLMESDPTIARLTLMCRGALQPVEVIV